VFVNNGGEKAKEKRAALNSFQSCKDQIPARIGAKIVFQLGQDFGWKMNWQKSGVCVVPFGKSLFE
jgi:hypothetical protein